jgi:peptidoglycan/xylan/chitin deacetylase (PgdA/CDA1 family)
MGRSLWRAVNAATAALLAIGVATAIAVVAPPASAAYGPQYVGSATVLRYGSTGRHEMSLTFDTDGVLGSTIAILDTLQARGVRATFGVTGEFAERYPSVFRRMVAEGHQIVNHSYDHPYFTQISQAELWYQLDRTEAIFRSLGADSAGWARPPYGARNSSVDAYLAQDGYSVDLLWNIDTQGYLGPTVPVVVQRVISGAHDGAIVLMHVFSTSTDAAALPQVIDELQARGYSLVPASDAAVGGAIWSTWLATGASQGLLGWPLTVELGTPDGVGRYNHFQRGSVYWTPWTGAHEIHGAIRDRWSGLGWETSFLGYPLTNETTTPDTIGRYNHFQGGSIYWSPATGAWEVHGAIRAKWASFGWEQGFLRYPETNETRTPDGYGRFNHFQGGSVYWSPATGAWEVHGAIRAKWAALGWERGFLRYPISDELTVTGGRASRFQGGNVYWSSATGTREVHGVILTRYLQLGATASALGFPVTDEYSISTGRQSDFQHGSILWNATTGAITVIYS